MMNEDYNREEPALIYFGQDNDTMAFKRVVRVASINDTMWDKFRFY